MGIGKFPLSFPHGTYPPTAPILFHLTIVRRLNLNWKQYMMVLQKKGNTLENPKKSKNNQRYEQKQLTHFFNDKAQTSSSVSNGTIATTGPMDKN